MSFKNMLNLSLGIPSSAILIQPCHFLQDPPENSWQNVIYHDLIHESNPIFYSVNPYCFFHTQQQQQLLLQILEEAHSSFHHSSLTYVAFSQHYSIKKFTNMPLFVDCLKIVKSLCFNNNFNNSSITTHLEFLMNFGEKREQERQKRKRENKEFICSFRSIKAKTPVIIFYQNSQNIAQIC